MNQRHRVAGVVAPLLLVAGLTGCGPYVGAHPNEGLIVDFKSSGCMREPLTGHELVRFTVQGGSDLTWNPTIVGFKLQDAPDAVLVGDDVLGPTDAAFTPATPPSEAEVRMMKKNADEEWLGVNVARDRRSTIVLLLQRTSAHVGDARLRIYWGGGEPVYYQDVDLAGLPSC